MTIGKALALAAVVIVVAGPLTAQESVLELDPAQTHVDLTLGATFHTVHGAFKLKRGTVRIDPATGKASGEVVVDATSGDTGNDSRDSRMHKNILESAKYPDIVFRPDHFEGKLPAEGSATLQVHGIFSIHGADHEITIPVQAQMKSDQVSVTMQFSVPYLKWGMRNPSTFVLRVSDKAEIEIRAAGRILPPRT